MKLSNKSLIAAVIVTAPFVAVRVTQAPPVGFPEEIRNPHSVTIGAQHAEFTQAYTSAIGATEIALFRQERAPQNGAWYDWDDAFTVSYRLTAVATRNGGDDLFIAGMKADGSTILEEWVFDQDPGRYVVRYNASPPALGQPQPSFVPQLAAKGGTWIEPPRRRTAAQPARTVLYEGSSGPLSALEADPEGRFLLAWDYGAKQLLRITWPRDQETWTVTFQTLMSHQSHAYLDQVGSIEIRDFGTEGRKCLMRRNYWHGVRATERYTILSDGNNDGEFESTATFTPTEFDASPYGNWEQWKEFWVVQ